MLLLLGAWASTNKVYLPGCLLLLDNLFVLTGNAQVRVLWQHTKGYVVAQLLCIMFQFYCGRMRKVMLQGEAQSVLKLLAQTVCCR